MADHTPEPWLDDKHGEPALYTPGGAVRIATFHRRKRAIADKDRARACVNACAGIPTGQLVAGSFTEVINVLRAILDDHESDLSLEAAEVARDALAPFRKD